MSTCYFPNGGISASDVACDADAADSFCCFTQQGCMSNKLCQHVDDYGVVTYARGTCTDKTWQSGACPNFCLDEFGLGNPVVSCNTTGVDSYCCNNGCSCDAGTEDEVLTFSGTPYTISVIGVASTFPNPSATTRSSTLTTSTLSSISRSVTISSSSTTIIGNITSSSSSSSVGIAAASGTALAQPSSSSSSTAIGVGVGVGVGVALLLTGAGSFYFFFIHRRRSRARRNATYPPRPPSSSDKATHTETETKSQRPKTLPRYEFHPYPAVSPDSTASTQVAPTTTSPLGELDSTGHGYSELDAQPTVTRHDIKELP